MSEEKGKTVDVDYEMGERVRIRVNDVRGRINGIWIDVAGIKYNVEWVNPDDTAIHTRWFVKEELDYM